tara:strand:+ start:332 stop:574 length:243 start_codon:yes stop_codon:yes gene_type:complete
MKYINVRVFLISLIFGIFLAYITGSPPSIIYVYPTPENIKDIQYKDHTGTCYSFTSQNVKCPSDTNKIRNYPIQKINSNN